MNRDEAMRAAADKEEAAVQARYGRNAPSSYLATAGADAELARVVEWLRAKPVRWPYLGWARSFPWRLRMAWITLVSPASAASGVAAFLADSLEARAHWPRKDERA